METQEHDNRSKSERLNSFGIVFLVIILCFSWVSIYFLFIIIFGLLPSAIAAVVDRYDKLYLTRMVLSCNITGIGICMQSVIHSTSKPEDIVIFLILNPVTWIILYVSAFAGWCIYWIVPELWVTVSEFYIVC